MKKIFLLSFLLSNCALTTATPTLNIGCLIETPQGIVMLQDLWSKKWSLPGGSVKSNETFVETAERNTAETTGLELAASKNLIEEKNGFKLFICKTTKPITHFVDGQIPTPQPIKRRIRKVQLQMISNLDPKDWRFYSQHDAALALINRNQTLSDTISIRNLNPTSDWLAAELKRVEWLQSLEGRLASTVFSVFNFLGEEKFFYLVLPFIWAFWRYFGAQITGLLALSTIINSTLKTIFMSTRPFDWDPSLIWMDADGFGAPSGHTQIATTFWICLAFKFRNIYFWILTLLAILGSGISRVYWGVHFPLDVTTGWIVGALLVLLASMGKKRLDHSRWDLKNTICWMIWFGAFVLGFLISPTPTFLSASSLWFGVLIGMKWKENLYDTDRWIITGSRIIQACMGVVGIFLIFAGFGFWGTANQTNAMIGFRYFLKYVSLGLWLSYGMFIWKGYPIKKNIPLNHCSF